MISKKILGNSVPMHTKDLFESLSNKYDLIKKVKLFITNIKRLDKVDLALYIKLEKSQIIKLSRSNL